MRQFLNDIMGDSSANSEELPTPAKPSSTLVIEREDYNIRPAVLRPRLRSSPTLSPSDSMPANERGQAGAASQSLFRIDVERTETKFKFQLSIGERQIPVDLTVFQSSLKQTMQELKSLFVSLPRRRLPKKEGLVPKLSKEAGCCDWRKT
ncbi:MAG: hypothetical protein GX589_07055 [Deltaproteobacteria bacterium]|nr:hypothetical protein [Deltaproteobacteria bacterium]